MEKENLLHKQNSFGLLTLLPFFIALEMFYSNFLIYWFILSKTLKVLYTKFLESVANIMAKFRLHTRINFLIKLNYLFSLYLYTLCIIQNGNISLMMVLINTIPYGTIMFLILEILKP